MKEKIYLFIGLIIGVISLYIAVKDIKISDFDYVMGHLNAWWILPMLICASLFFVCKALRWKLLLQPIYKANTKELYSSIMIGSSVGYILSVYLGEVVRAFCFAKQCNVNRSSVIASVLLERLFDLFILLLFFGIALIYTPDLPFDTTNVGYAFTLMGATLFAIMMFAVFMTDKCLKIVHFCFSWLPNEMRHQLVKQVDLGILGLHSLKSPKLLFGVLAISLTGWLFMASTNHIAMLVVGIDQPIYASFLIMGLIVVVMSLPNPPGSIGVIEWCYVVSLRAYGVDSAAAFAAAIVFHVFLYTGVIVTGFYYAKKMHLSLRQAAEEASDNEAK